MSEWLPHLLRVEDAFHVLARPFGVPSYDFDFERLLACSHPVYLPEGTPVVARVGPVADYPAFYALIREELGLRLVNSPEESSRANDLREWYPRLGELTARSIWFEGEVSADRVERELGWPVFVKTVQQTLRHRREFAIVPDREALARSVAAYRADPVLGAQPIVVRELLDLAPSPFAPSHPERIPGGLELRTFFWRGRLVGEGTYWIRDGRLALPEEERARALTVAQECARRLEVPFLVIDLAKTRDGRWLALEANDAQESGYAGVAPLDLWTAVAEAEKG